MIIAESAFVTVRVVFCIHVSRLVKVVRAVGMFTCGTTKSVQFSSGKCLSSMGDSLCGCIYPIVLRQGQPGVYVLGVPFYRCLVWTAQAPRGCIFLGDSCCFSAGGTFFW